MITSLVDILVVLRKRLKQLLSLHTDTHVIQPHVHVPVHVVNGKYSYVHVEKREFECLTIDVARSHCFGKSSRVAA